MTACSASSPSVSLPKSGGSSGRVVAFVAAVAAVVDGESGGPGGRSSFADCVVDVLLAVVFPAEEFEVVERGGSAFGPVDDVVCLAVGRAAGASGFGAVPVAGDECVPQRLTDGAGRAADV